MTPENENLLRFGKMAFPIPESGEIQRRTEVHARGTFPPEMTKKIIPSKMQFGGYTIVRLTYIPRSDIEYNLLIVWADKINEWVEFEHESWVESSLIPHEESVSGPWALEKTRAEKITEVFGVKQATLSFEKIRNMSPEKLEDLAKLESTKTRADSSKKIS